MVAVTALSLTRHALSATGDSFLPLERVSHDSHYTLCGNDQK